MDVEQLYKLYYIRVYSYVLGMVRNPWEAEEITQEAFVKATLSKKTYKGESGEFTWLCSIAKNLCMDFFREEQRRGDLSNESQIPAPSNMEEDFIRRAASFEIHKILHELKDPYKEVFELRVFGELSFAEISKIFGKTESWARVTYHRARLKIKERIDRDE